MLKSFALFAAVLSVTLPRWFEQNAIAAPQRENVAVTASAERSSATEVDLTVRATIESGLHIYALTQRKPILATQISVMPSDVIQSVGSFEPLTEPLSSIHPDLDIEILEHRGIAEWKSRIVVKSGQEVIKISGSLFAQAGEDEKCFAPESYPFNVEVEAFASTIAPATELAPNVTVGDSSIAQGKVAFALADLNVAAQQQPSQSIWSVLPLAFVAGFLLNFMPCVLPVMGLKLLSFVQQANADRKRILFMNLAYTAGLMSVMLVLATLAVFAGLGWGQQFSSAAFTVTLAAIVFAFGLSFLGVWEIPLSGFVGTAGRKAPREGYAGAFSKGLLSTLLATPCSGPFLGAALAWAVTQSAYLTYTVFAVVGLGMASPYLLIGAVPSLIRYLPKPGNWMVAFKQIMGFIMLTTVVYLMSFMPIAAVVPTVLLFVGIGAALWYAGQTPLYASPIRLAKTWMLATGFVVMVSFASFGWLQGVMQARFERAAQRLLADASQQSVQNVTKKLLQETIRWETYSPDRLETLLQAGTPVFIDFTADWCLTCKANEAAAIETTQVGDAIRARMVIAIKADKTEPNAPVDDLLRQLGNSAASIPFYAVFPAGRPTEPVLLDGLYSSPKPFVNAIRQSTKQSANVSAMIGG